MTASSKKWGMPLQNRAKNEANTAPMISWPSPPMFQKRILKASVTPRAEMHMGMQNFTVAWKAMGERKQPEMMVP